MNTPCAELYIDAKTAAKIILEKYGYQVSIFSKRVRVAFDAEEIQVKLGIIMPEVAGTEQLIILDTQRTEPQ
jgi:hypothetical protein